MGAVAMRVFLAALATPLSCSPAQPLRSLRRFLSNLWLWRSMSWVEYGNRLTIGFHMLADFTANLQVFYRQKSGNGCPVYVCLFPVRGAAVCCNE